MSDDYDPLDKDIEDAIVRDVQLKDEWRRKAAAFDEIKKVVANIPPYERFLHETATMDNIGKIIWRHEREVRDE